MNLFKRKGLTTTEYVILIAVLIAAVLAMQTQLRRAICGKWRAAADSISGGL